MSNIEDTIFNDSLPVNTIAMLNRGIEILKAAKTNSSNYLTTGEARHQYRKLMWLLMSQISGSVAVIDMIIFWEELKAKEEDYR